MGTSTAGGRAVLHSVRVSGCHDFAAATERCDLVSDGSCQMPALPERVHILGFSTRAASIAVNTVNASRQSGADTAAAHEHSADRSAIDPRRCDAADDRDYIRTSCVSDLWWQGARQADCWSTAIPKMRPMRPLLSDTEARKKGYVVSRYLESRSGMTAKRFNNLR